MPVVDGVNGGFCKEEVKPVAALQLHAVALVEFALSVVLPVKHIGFAPTVGPLDVGTGFTLTGVVKNAPVLQPLPVVLTVTLYTVVPAVVGTAVVGVPVVAPMPVPLQ